jgi:hypothetical protein
MNSVARLFALSQQFTKRKFLSVGITAMVTATNSIAFAAGGSAAASFQVTVQVVRSCRVSTGSGRQSAVDINCGQSTLSSAPIATPESSATPYPAIEKTLGADGTQFVTVNF